MSTRARRLDDVAAPVSWFLLEPGWEVRGRDGAPLGTVAEVLGIPGDDIFDGLMVATDRGEPRYVPADRVARIEEGAVELSLAADELDRIDPA